MCVRACPCVCGGTRGATGEVWKKCQWRETTQREQGPGLLAEVLEQAVTNCYHTNSVTTSAVQATTLHASPPPLPVLPKPHNPKP